MKNKANKLELIIGIFFLIPPVLGVFSFLINCLTGGDCMFFASNVWHPRYGINNAVTSPVPIYLGLMAIAGAYLIKDTAKFFTNKEEKNNKKV